MRRPEPCSDCRRAMREYEEWRRRQPRFWRDDSKVVVEGVIVAPRWRAGGGGFCAASLAKLRLDDGTKVPISMVDSRALTRLRTRRVRIEGLVHNDGWPYYHVALSVLRIIAVLPEPEATG